MVERYISTTVVRLDGRSRVGDGNLGGTFSLARAVEWTVTRAVFHSLRSVPLRQFCKTPQTSPLGDCHCSLQQGDAHDSFDATAAGTGLSEQGRPRQWPLYG